MKKTTNLQLNKPEATDYYDIDVQNANMDIIDDAISGKADRSELFSGSYMDLSDKPDMLVAYDDSALRTRVTTVETTLETKANKSELFSKKYSDLTGTPTSLPANGGNSDTVDGLHMVTMTQAAYNTLATKDTSTIYYIVG